jgi:hypothetical protein
LISGSNTKTKLSKKHSREILEGKTMKDLIRDKFLKRFDRDSVDEDTYKRVNQTLTLDDARADSTAYGH